MMRSPDRRGSARARGYTHKWDKAAAVYKRAHPLCTMCQVEGKVRAAYAVDHIIPHKGDQTLMWDEANWQALCQAHHNGAKQSEEKLGYRKGVDASGVPLDPQHHWRA